MLKNILYLTLFGSFSICSSTLLWRIEISPPSYIFGSIHIPYKLVWPYVSNETKQAFLSSTHFYAEIDAKNDTYWDDFLQCLVNRSRRTRRLSNSVHEGTILDVYLTEEARRLNKTVGGLEPPEHHCEREGWRYSLATWRILVDTVKKEMKNPRLSLIGMTHYTKQLILKNYICDEIDGQYMQTLSKLDSDNILQHIEKRDEQMSRSIHTLLNHSNNGRYFFAIGAGHMLGKHQNIIVRLKKLGYKITRVCTNRNRIKRKFGCKKKKIMKHCMKKKS